jgi:type IX secretion system PorP/SprF family membrane protein
LQNKRSDFKFRGNFADVPKTIIIQKCLYMHVRNLLPLFAFLCFAGGALRAQDIHFTQYNMSPLTLNPALVGGFEGSLRIGGIYRGQWASVLGSSNQYKTPSIWADAPIIRGFRRNDWVGVGFSFFNDKAGTGNFRRTTSKLGAAYHLALDKKGKTVLALGAQYGRGSWRIDGDLLKFESDLLKSTTPEPFKNVGSDDKATFADIDAGVTLTSVLNKRMNIRLGFAMQHLTEPKITWGGGGGARIPRRALLHGQFNAALTDRFSITPSFLFQTMGGADEIVLQGLGNFLFDERRGITFNFGLGYRMKDALQAIIGGSYKDWQVGLAYDINTSDLNAASNFRGGFELAANRIIRIYKPAKIKTKVLCPRF